METHRGPHPDADSHEPYDPREALADAEATRASLADRLITPWWYHPALGAIMGAIVLVMALDLNVFVRLVVAIVCAAGIGLLVGTYQRVTGLWVDVRNLGSTSVRWWGAYLVMVVVLVGVAMVPSLTNWQIPAWVAVLLAVLIFVGTIILGRQMDEAMRAEIRSGAAPTPRAKR